MRMATPLLAFLVVFVVVYTVTTLAILVAVPAGGGHSAFPPDVSANWQVWPGLVLGLLAGLHSAMATRKLTGGGKRKRSA